MQAFTKFQRNNFCLRHQCIVVARLQPGQEPIQFRVNMLGFLSMLRHGAPLAREDTACPRDHSKSCHDYSGALLDGIVGLTILERGTSSDAYKSSIAHDTR